MACGPVTSQRNPELKAFASAAKAKEVDLATEMTRKARVENLLERRNLIDCSTLGRGILKTLGIPKEISTTAIPNTRPPSTRPVPQVLNRD